MERRDTAGRQLIEQRLVDLDKARQLAADQLRESPEQDRDARDRLGADFSRQMVSEREYIMAQIQNVQAVMAEKFTAVDGQFTASKTAVDVALTAQKEAVGEQNKANDRSIAKSETAVAGQLDSLRQVADAGFRALEDKITDARDRITVIEALTRGIEQAGGKGISATRFDETQRRALISAVISAVAVIVSVVAVVVLIIRK